MLASPKISTSVTDYLFEIFSASNVFHDLLFVMLELGRASLMHFKLAPEFWSKWGLLRGTQIWWECELVMGKFWEVLGRASLHQLFSAVRCELYVTYEEQFYRKNRGWKRKNVLSEFVRKHRWRNVLLVVTFSFTYKNSWIWMAVLHDKVQKLEIENSLPTRLPDGFFPSMLKGLSMVVQNMGEP